jgi:hypothetical protein
VQLPRIRCASATVICGPEPEIFPADEYPNLDLVKEEMRHSLNLQRDSWDQASANARNLLTATSILVAALAISPLSIDKDPLISDRSLLLAILLYALTAFCAIKGFEQRDFSEAPKPLGLAKRIAASKEELNLAIVVSMMSVHHTNCRELVCKDCWVMRAQRLLLLEAVCFLVAVFWHQWGR